MPIPKYTTASTLVHDASTSRTSGMVSRVSPPAQSTGLLRDHLATNKSSSRAITSSGNSASRNIPSRLSASAVTTPHPPAVVRIATRLPRGSGDVAKNAAASKASSTPAARTMPSWRHSPENTSSFDAKAPVWLDAARAPSADAPPLSNTMGLRATASSSAVRNR